MRLEM